MRTFLALCTTLAPLLVAALACPEGFDDLGLDPDFCYMYSTDKKSWTESYTTCLTSANGTGHLLVVPDASSYYTQYYQVRAHGENLWTGLLNIAGQYSWADGTPYDSSIDQFIAADAGDETFGYMSADDGLFRFGDGSSAFGYACYVDLTTTPTTPAPTEPPPPCSEGWEQYDDTCYLFHTSEPQQYWPSAGHACHEEDAELISIHDSNLLTFLLLTADPAVTYWTGLENQNETYVWEDGTNTTEVDTILKPYMDEWTEGNDCVALFVGDFPVTFLHMSCLTQQNYICYKAALTNDFFEDPEDLDFKHWL